MEHFVIVVNYFQPLTIITKCSVLDVAAALDRPLIFWPIIFPEELQSMVTHQHLHY